MNRVGHLTVTCLVAFTLAWAQAPLSQELKQLEPLVGQWACSVETRTPPIDKSTGSLECAWDKGGRILICQQQMQWRTASTSFASAWTYDASSMTYAWVILNSNGFPQILSGSVQNGTKRFARDGVWMGKPAKYEMESNIASDSMNYRWHRSSPGGPSILIEEGKCTRQK